MTVTGRDLDTRNGGERGDAGRGRAVDAAILAIEKQFGRGAIMKLGSAEKQQVASALEEDAEIMSNTQLQQQLASQPPAIQQEIIRINTEARHLALQVALLVPLLAALIGLVNSLRMRRLPDPEPSEAAEGLLVG